MKLQGIYYEPATRCHVLEDILEIPAPLPEVFSFFEKASNLGRITPPQLRMTLLTPEPVRMATGTVLDYTISVRGMPLRWTSVIAHYDPPHRFVDVQIRGPYGFWHHTHEFQASAEGTRIRDRVVYQLPFGPVGRLINRLMVARDVQAIFEYREKTLRRIFNSTPG